jgi:formylglycine-generating enzyme required for sulfatase activity
MADDGVEGRPPEPPISRELDEADRAARGKLPLRVPFIGLGVIASAIAIGFTTRAIVRHFAAERAKRAPMDHVAGAVFSVGEEKRSTRVAGFEIDHFEVTVAAFGVCVRAGKCAPPPRGEGCNYERPDRQDHPMNCVDWSAASTYCEVVGKRLPHEEEWELAARSKDERTYPWGNQPPDATRLNACDAACERAAKLAHGPAPSMFHGDDGFDTTAPVGSFEAGASPVGALDMAGNVEEWTADDYCPGKGPCITTLKVARGGSYATVALDGVTTTARRGWSSGGPTIGFRCAR